MKSLTQEFEHIGKIRVSYGLGNKLIRIEERVKLPNTFLKNEKIEWRTIYHGFSDVLKTSLKIYDDLKNQAVEVEKVMSSQMESRKEIT